MCASSVNRRGADDEHARVAARQTLQENDRGSEFPGLGRDADTCHGRLSSSLRINSFPRVVLGFLHSFGLALLSPCDALTLSRRSLPRVPDRYPVSAGAHVIFPNAGNGEGMLFLTRVGTSFLSSPVLVFRWPLFFSVSTPCSLTYGISIYRSLCSFLFPSPSSKSTSKLHSSLPGLAASSHHRRFQAIPINFDRNIGRGPEYLYTSIMPLARCVVARNERRQDLVGVLCLSF